MATFRPLHDHVVIRREEPEKVSRGGIIIPDTVRSEQRKKGNLGTVIKIGPGRVWAGSGRKVPPPDVKVGDRVVFGAYVREYDLPEGKLVVAAAGEVLAVVEPD